MRSNPNLRPSRLKKRRRKIFAIKTAGIFLLLVGFVFFLSWLSKISAIQITEIEVLGNATISKEEIIDLARKETSRKYLALFSQNSIFLYPKESIREKILKDYKQVKKAEISSKGLNGIIVNLTERKPEFTWCAGDGEVEIKINEGVKGCYFMDEEGMVFGEAPDFSGNTHTGMRYFGLIGGSEPIGKIYTQGTKLKEIINFISALNSMGMTAVGFQADPNGEYETYLQNGIKIISDDRQPFDKTLGNIQSILGEIDLKKSYSAINPPKYNVVDLRLGNKIFLKNE